MARQWKYAAEGAEDVSNDELLPLGASMLTVVRRVLGKEQTDIEDVAQQGAFAFRGSLARFRQLPEMLGVSAVGESMKWCRNERLIAASRCYSKRGGIRSRPRGRLGDLQ